MEQFGLQILWPYVYRSLDLAVAQLAPLLSIPRALGVVLGPMWGYLGDRLSRKWLIVIMTGFWGLWTGAVGFADTYSQLLAFRILATLGLGVLGPASVSLLGDFFGRKERGRAIGFLSASGYLGNLFSLVVLGALAATRPEAWRIGFLIIGGLSFLTGLLVIGVREPVRGAAEPELSDVVTVETAAHGQLKLIPHLLKIATWKLVLVIETVDFIGYTIISAWIITWLDQLGMGAGAQLVMALIGLGIILGHLSFGWLSDVMDKRDPRHGRAILGQIGYIVHVTSAVGLLTLGAQSLAYLLVFGMLFGLSFSLKSTGSMSPILQSVLPPELRATGRAVINWCSTLVTAAGVALSGWVLTMLGNDMQTMLLVMVPFPILVATLLWPFIFRTYPKDMDLLKLRLDEQRQQILLSQSKS
jgi:MFS family permease